MTRVCTPDQVYSVCRSQRSTYTTLRCNQSIQQYSSMMKSYCIQTCKLTHVLQQAERATTRNTTCIDCFVLACHRVVQGLQGSPRAASALLAGLCMLMIMTGDLVVLIASAGGGFGSESTSEALGTAVQTFQETMWTNKAIGKEAFDAPAMLWVRCTLDVPAELYIMNVPQIWYVSQSLCNTAVPGNRICG